MCLGDPASGTVPDVRTVSPLRSCLLISVLSPAPEAAYHKKLSALRSGTVPDAGSPRHISDPSGQLIGEHAKENWQVEHKEEEYKQLSFFDAQGVFGVPN